MHNLPKINVWDQLDDNHIKVGDKLKFKAIMADLSTFDSTSVKGRLCVISVVPSLQNFECDSQTENLLQALDNFDDVRLITISGDLPFTNSRLGGCKPPKDPHYTVVSDYHYHDFSQKTGLMLRDLQYLCRSIIILNRTHEVVYEQIVNPLSAPVNVTEILDFIKTYTSD